jgi:energy-coupling factor transport system ATP-binding protein
MSLALPTPIRVYSSVEDSHKCPVTVAQGREWLLEFIKENEVNPCVISNESSKRKNADVTVEIKDAWFRYEKDSPDAGNSRHVDSLLYDKEG